MDADVQELAVTLPEAWEGWWLPRRPLCCDEYDEQRRRSRADALAYRMVEVNPSAVADLLVVDVDDDSAGASATWGHAGMMPNLVTTNPRNLHSHAVWVLTHPVPTTEYARRRPVALMHTVLEGLRRSCGGDPGYSSHLTKNPLSPVWESELVTTHTYELGELAAALEASGDMPPRSWRRTKGARTTGLGRNCSIFEVARVDAYRYIRRLPDRSAASSRRLRDHIRATCHDINATFPEPLGIREVGDIARSIHKWITTESRMWLDGAAVYAATLTTIQSARGRKSGQARRSKRASQQQAFMEACHV